MNTEEGNSKVRGAISAISAAIIVYVVAGGQFDGKASLIIGSVTFARPWMVEISILLLYGYWFYRLKVNEVKPWERFKDSINHLLKEDKEFKIFVNTTLDSESQRIIDELNQDKGETFSDVKIGWDSKHRDFLKVKKDEIEVRYEAKRTVQGVRVKLKQDYINIDSRSFWKHFRRMTYDSDYLFTILAPWALAWTAGIFIAYRIIVEIISLFT